ncbi:MAG: hypothetical protein ACR2OB_08830 [Solirubrobacteraceae bacterium]
MTSLRAVPSALGGDAVARVREFGAGRQSELDGFAGRIEDLERELEAARHESQGLRDLVLVGQRARLIGEQRAYAERAQRIESEELLLRRIDEADHVAAAMQAARAHAQRAAAQANCSAASAERRAKHAESLAAGLERLLRDDTARCAHVYEAVHRLQDELDAVRSMSADTATPAPERSAASAPPPSAAVKSAPAKAQPPDLATVEPDRLAAALTRLRGGAPPPASGESEPREPVRRWRAAWRRWTRRLA